MNIFTTYHQGLEAKLLELTTEPTGTHSLNEYQLIEPNAIRGHIRIHVGFWRLRGGPQIFTSPVEIPQTLSTNVPLIMALLTSLDPVPASAFEGVLIVGKLDSDRHIKPVPSVMNSAITASLEGFHTIIVPKGQGVEADQANTALKIIEVETLYELQVYLRDPKKARKRQTSKKSKKSWRAKARRVFTIAATGNHPLLLCGSSSITRSLAFQFSSLLPKLNSPEVRELAQLKSYMMEFEAPFERPYHIIGPKDTHEALFGTSHQLGIIARSHHGLVHMEHVNRFHKAILERSAKIHRDTRSYLWITQAYASFPTQFFMVGTSEKQPPGWLGKYFPLVLNISKNNALPVFGDAIETYRDLVKASRNRRWNSPPVLTDELKKRLKARHSRSQRKKILEIANTIGRLESAEHITWKHLKEAARYI